MPALVDTLLINGTDIASVPGLVVEDFSGLHIDPPFRGDNVTLPGRPGQIGLVKVRDAYTFDLPVTLLELDSGGASGATLVLRRGQFLANLAALQALMPTNLVTLTRRLSTSSSYVDTACNAEYVPATAFTLLNAHTGRTVLQFLNLSGSWS